MNSNLIMESDILDIVFENRNKAYGAYDLRKFYQNRLYKSIAIMLTGVLLLCCLALLQKSGRPDELLYTEGPTILASVYQPKPSEPVKHATAAKHPVKTAAVKPVHTNAGNKVLYARDSVQQVQPVKNLTVTTGIPASILATPAGTADNGNPATGAGEVKAAGEGANPAAIDVNAPRSTADVYPS